MKDDLQKQVVEPVQTVVQKLEGWLDTFISMLPNMAVTLPRDYCINESVHGKT